MGHEAQVKRPLPGLAAIFVFGGLCNTSLLCGPAIASELERSLGYSSGQVGTYFSIEFAGYFFAGLLGSRLLPRADWRVLAAAAALVFLAGSLVSILVLDSFQWLVPVRLASVTGAAFLSTICLAHANSSANPGRSIAILIIGQLVGGVIGLATLPMLFHAFGLKAYFLSVALLVLVAMPMVRALSGAATAGPEPARGCRRGSDLVLLLRFPAVFFFYAGMSGIWTFAGDLGEHAGLAASIVGRTLSLATVGGIAGAMLAGQLHSLASSGRKLAIGYLLLLSSSLGLGLLANSMAYLVAALAFKFAWTFVVPFIFAVIGTFDRDGKFMAEGMMVTGLGLAAGPSIAGQIIQHSGSLIAMVLAGVLMLALGWASISRLSGMVGKRAHRTEIDSRADQVNAIAGGVRATD